jgi:Ataxin-3
MELIYHEQQEGSLCAKHCLNSLLQGDYYSAVELAQIGEQLDKEEMKHMFEGGVTKEYEKFLNQGSSNFDDSGFFSIQVLQKALTAWNLELVPYSSESGLKQRQIVNNQQKPSAYILNFKEHWYSIRKIGNYWFNLNSMLKEPELITDTYLSILLAQLQNDGYSIFIVIGDIPKSPAQDILSNQVLDVKRILKQKSAITKSKKSNQDDDEEDDDELKKAIQMSLIENDLEIDSNTPIIINSNSKPSTSKDSSQNSVVEESKPVDHDEIRRKRLEFLSKFEKNN